MQNKIPSPIAEAQRPAPRTAGAAVDRAVDRSLRGRRESAADEVGRLVAAALALIDQTGELEPRVSEIVRRAGVHNQAFYRHFRSKRELLVAVLDHGVVILASYLRHRMSQAATGEEQVRAWIGGVLEQALNEDAAHATRPFVLGRGRLAEAYPAEVARSEEQLTSLLIDAIERARSEGALASVDPQRDADAIYLLTLAWIGRCMVATERPTRADAHHLTEFAMGALARGPRSVDRPERTTHD